MGLLRAVHSGRTLWLVRPLLVGRDLDCGLVLTAPGVSRRHFSISWLENGWYVRDHGSTNGTWLGGERIPNDQDVPVRAGQRIVAGRNDEAVLELCSDDPPGPVARHRDTGEERGEDTEGRIELEEGTLWRDLEQGGWVIEDAQGVRPVEGATVGPWTLVEPGFLPPTVQEWRSLADASLLFRVAGDHQATALVLRWGVTELDLGWAQPFWPLLLIARARGTGDGWLAMDTLVRRSGLRRGTLEIYLLRVRERLERAGLADADTLVEVRPGQRRLGLPADRVQESREGPPPG